ncbi:unnamed protein product [Victoria cruziana]
MAPSAARFIDTAFARTGSFFLPYTHHKHKLLIRQHLLSLLNEFPSLSPRASHFTADGGATFYLLSATGTIASTPLTIWLPPTYPVVPPLVFLSVTAAVIQDHPFVDPTTGAVLTPYLLTWRYPSSNYNLLGLARNLRHIFHLCSPLLSSSSTTGRRPPNPSLISKQEAIDRLALALFYDVAAFRRQTAADLNELALRQSLLQDRSLQLDDAVVRLESELSALRQRTEAMNSRSEVLQNWLEENRTVPGGELEEILECPDGVSMVLLESSAADRAIDDVMDRLDGALQEGRFELGAYMRLVRSLAREQFLHRAQHRAAHQRRTAGS